MLDFFFFFPEQPQVLAWYASQKLRSPEGIQAFGVIKNNQVIAVSNKFPAYRLEAYPQKFSKADWEYCEYPGVITGISDKLKTRAKPEAFPEKDNRNNRSGQTLPKLKDARKRKRLSFRVKSFIAAVSGPKTSEETYKARLRICQSNACKSFRQRGEKMFCGACGCPNWRLAELHSKLWYANLECPLDFWGRETEAKEGTKENASKK